MFEGKDGHVAGSIDRARVVELYNETNDDELKAYYRDVLGESDEGKALDEESGEDKPEATEAPAGDADLDELRAQAEGLGIKVDGRWGEQRLRDEIAAYKPESEG